MFLKGNFSRPAIVLFTDIQVLRVVTAQLSSLEREDTHGEFKHHGTEICYLYLAFFHPSVSTQTYSLSHP